MKVKPEKMKINQPTDDNPPKWASILWRFHPVKKYRAKSSGRRPASSPHIATTAKTDSTIEHSLLPDDPCRHEVAE